MKPPPIIETERLVLRLPEQSEASVALDFFVKNRKHLEPWNPVPVPNFYTIEFWEGALWDNINGFANGESLRTFVFRRGELQTAIGNCNLSNVVRGAFHAAYLGYNLDADLQGEGLMTEAVRAIVQFGFEEMNLHRIMANYIPANLASARVLEKAGFQREGLAKNYLRINGEWRDHILTACTSDVWSEKPPKNR